MEHSGTFRNILEHRINMMIMRKICKIKLKKKIEVNRNKLLSTRNMKRYTLGGGGGWGVGESVEEG